MKKLLSILLLAVCLVGILASCAAPEESSNPDGITITNALDLTAEWDKTHETGSLVQGCIVVRTAFLEQYPAAVESFLTEYEASINYLNANAADAATKIVENGIFANAKVAEQAIPRCNVRYLDGDTMKSAMQVYLGVLEGINANAIGGKLPGDDFYYSRNNIEATTEASPEKINIYTLNGTTGFGMAKMMSDNKDNSLYAFSVKSDASEILQALIKGEVDIAALPTNAASTVYNRTEGGVKMLAVNTLGCLYLLTKEGTTVSSFADLKGKTVYVPAQNPTFIFTELCKKNNLVPGTDIIIDSTSYQTPADLRTAVAAGKVDIAVLPEPMATMAIAAAKAAK